MKTLLTFNRYTKDERTGLLRPIDSRQQWSRSFTMRLIELLYLQHAQITLATPYPNGVDITGSTRSQMTAQAYGSAEIYYQANLRLCGPQGNTRTWCGPGGANSVGQYENVLGHLLGIQVGRDATAAIPLDYSLHDRVDHGLLGSIAGPSVIESHVSAQTTHTLVQSSASCVGVMVNPTRSMIITSVTFQLYRTGNPGNVTAYISAWKYDVATVLEPAPIAASAAVNGNLWGTTTPGAPITFTFATPVQLHAGQSVVIWLNGTTLSTNNGYDMMYGASYTQWHTGGSAGVNATSTPNPSVGFGNLDYDYALTGSAGAQMLHGGTDFLQYTVANPTASFGVRKLFTNLSGETINVQEAGLHAIGVKLGSNSAGPSGGPNAFVMCIARDAVSPAVSVLNNQLLEVIYTPQISV